MDFFKKNFPTENLKILQKVAPIGFQGATQCQLRDSRMPRGGASLDPRVPPTQFQTPWLESRRHFFWIWKRFQLIPSYHLLACFQLFNFKTPAAPNDNRFTFVSRHFRVLVGKITIWDRDLVETHSAIETKMDWMVKYMITIPYSLYDLSKVYDHN